MVNALSQITQASQRARRVESGGDLIPAVWRAEVSVVRPPGDPDAGVYVVVPRLAGEAHLGPLPWVGSEPAPGDRVLVAAVEGRKDDLIIINPVPGASSEAVAQLARDVAAAEVRIQALDAALESTHGESVNAIGILETQMLVLEAENRELRLQTGLDVAAWLTSGTIKDVQIPGYAPQPVARSYRLEADLVTEGLKLTTDARIWLRVMSGSTVLVETGNVLMVNAAGDTHRYRVSLDFNAAASVPLFVRFAAHGGVQGGRLGITRPVLSTAVERSA